MNKIILKIISILMTIYFNFTQAKMPVNFTTEQILAEKVTAKHEKFLAQIILNTQVQQAYNTGDLESFTNISAQLSIITKQWEEFDFGLYILFEKQSNEFIGFAGFHSVFIDNNTVNALATNSADQLEIYAFFMPQHWRKGYGFKIFTHLINLAFRQLNNTSIIAYIEPKNESSLGLIKKLNFKKESLVNYNNKPHILYRLRLKTI